VGIDPVAGVRNSDRSGCAARRNPWHAVDETALLEASGRFYTVAVDPADARRTLFENFFNALRRRIGWAPNGEPVWEWAKLASRHHDSPAFRLQHLYARVCAQERVSLPRLHNFSDQARRTTQVTTALQELERALQQSLSFNVMGLLPCDPGVDDRRRGARARAQFKGLQVLGKTLLSKSLAAAIGGNFKRIQGTADLMPSDIIGGARVRYGARRICFSPGPLFTDVLLFDEINRAGPKDPVGAAGGHGGAPGVGRSRQLHACRRGFS